MSKPGSPSKSTASFIFVGSLLIGVIVAFAAWLFTPPAVVTDPTRYAEHVANWPMRAASIEHFPEQIPTNAAFVRFASFPGFGQHAPFIQLRLRLPAEDVDRIESETIKRAIGTCSGGVFPPKLLIGGRGRSFLCRFLTDTVFESNEIPREPFPTDAMIYVLGLTDDPEPESHGIVIRRDRDEVIYWAE